MAAFSWRRWLGSLFARRANAKQNRRQRLRLELLENRLAPATFTWSGASGLNNNWSTPGNWVGNAAPSGSAATLDNLVFPGGVSLLNSNNNLLPIGTTLPTFNSITISGNNYNISGLPLILGSANATGSGTLTVPAGAFGDVIALNVGLGGAAGAKQFFTVNAGATVTITGKLSGSTGSTLTKEGSGTLILSGDNSAFTGPVALDNTAGTLEITTATALGSGSSATAVGNNSTLAISNVTGIIAENLILNGPGASGNQGALLNLSGNNTLSGNIELDSDAYFGATAGVLDITGSISDTGSGHNVTKVGQGTVSFDAADTYRGSTTINNGILRIENGLALGAADGTTATGTVVNTTTNGSGTLQLYSPNGFGFTVPNERLDLNGDGFNAGGALDNLAGANVWTGNVYLDNSSPTGDPSPGQGVLGPSIASESIGQTPTVLTITGHLIDGVAGAELDKSGTGEVALTNSNTAFTGPTNILAGIIDIRDSQALGVSGAGGVITAFSGGALWLDVDNLPDSITGTTNSLFITQALEICGTGVNNSGALRSVTGINTWNGTLLPFLTGNFTPTTDGIGVAPDPNESSTASYLASDYSLTIAQPIADLPAQNYYDGRNGPFQNAATIPGGAVGDPYATIEKLGGGNLILPADNTYVGPTIVAAGWITAENSNSLGSQFVGFGQTIQSTTTVLAGAAVDLKAPTANSSLTLWNNFILAGMGIKHNFNELNQQGALVSLSGNNIIDGNIQLNGVAGIGVVADLGPNPGNSLNIRGQTSDAPTAPAPGGGITKLGSERLFLSGPGTYTGPVDIRQGVIQVLNSTGLGAPNGGTVTVENNAALEINGSTPSENGGLATGIEIWGRHLILNGLGTTIDTVSDATLVNLANFDNAWQGPVTLSTNAQIDTEPNSRLIVLGAIDDATNLAATGSDLTKIDTGELMLSGTNTYRGKTLINSGIVTIANGQALGAPSGGIVNVALGAQIQLESGITVAGKTITVQGTGTPNAPTTSPTWFPVGPASSTGNGNSSGNGSASGRVTSVAVDPADANVIYIATAGGGAWKTINGGQTWVSLFEGYAAMYAGAIAVDPTDPRVIYLGTGAPNNNADSYYGTGVYRSTDSGQTWSLLVNADNTAPFVRTSITSIVVDPNDPESIPGTWATPANPVIYVANSDLAVNGTQAQGDIGVWRYSADPPIQGGIQYPKWFDLTGAVSTNRNPITAPTGTTTAPPGTPGPDDDFRISFPQENAAWTSLVIAHGPQTAGPDSYGWELYAALGTYFGAPALVQNPANTNTWVIPNKGSGAVVDNIVYRIDLSQVFYTINFVDPPPHYSPNNPYPQPINPDYGTQYGYANPVWFAGGGFIDNNPLHTTTYGTILGVDSENGEMNSPLAGQTYPNGTIELAANPGTPIIYAAIAHDAFEPWGQALYNNYTDGSLWRVYESTDGGFTWNTITPTTDYLTNQGWFANAIAISPTNANEVFVGGAGNILASTNAGGTWVDISVDALGNGPQLGVHALAVDSNGNLDTGTNGGVWQFGAATTGNWSDLNTNLDISLVNSVDGSQVNPNVMVAGASDTGASTNSGAQAWGWDSANNAGQVAFNPSNSNIVYYAGDGQLWESTQGGTPGSFNPILTVPNSDIPAYTAERTTGLFPFALDGVNNSRLLVGGDSIWQVETNGVIDHISGQALEETVDGGATWTNIGNGNNTIYVGGNNFEQFWITFTGPWLPSTAPYQFEIPISQVATVGFQGAFQPDPAFPGLVDNGSNTYDPNTFYVSDYYGNVFLTKDHGTNWVVRTPSGVTNGGFLQQLYVDPTNENTVYAIYSAFGGDQIMKTTNGGQTWASITLNLPDLPVFSITSDPRSGNLFIGNDNGVWMLPNNGTVWSRVGSGMPNIQVDSLVINQNLNTITAGTYGGGVYELYIDDVQSLSGAIRAVSGQSSWTGPVQLVANTTISAEGTQAVQNGVSTASLTILGTISDATAGGDFTITKIGNGDVVFAGANTYGGLTIVQQGVLIVDNPTALGATGANQGTIVEAGAALDLESNLDAEPIQLNGDGIVYQGHNTGALDNISNNNSYDGVITLDSNTTIGVNSGSSLTLAYPGSITDGANSFNLTKELAGTLILQTADSYHGQTQVDQGVLNIQNSAALGSTGSLATVLDGAQLQLQGNIDVINENLRLSGTGIFGSGALENVGGINVWEGSVTLAQDPAFAPVSTPPAAISIGSLAANPTDELFITGAIGGANATTGLIKVGPGALVLDDSNTYTGGTLVQAGALRIQQSLALGPIGTVAVVAAGAELQLDGDPAHVGSALNIHGVTLTLNGNGLPSTQGGAVDSLTGNNTWAGNVVLGSPTSIGAEAAGGLQITGVVTDPSPLTTTAASLTKVGPGSLYLGSADTYGGTTTVSNGILLVGNATSLGITSPEIQKVTINATGSAGSFTLSFNGQTTDPIAHPLAYNATAGQVAAALNALLTIGGVGGSVNVTQSANVYTVTFGGTLLGLNLPQMTGTGANGVSVAVATFANGAGGVVVNSGGTLELVGGISVNSYALTLNGNGFSNLGALLGSGGLNTWGGNGIWATDITLGSNASVGANGSTLGITTPITDNGHGYSLTKYGSGTVLLAGNVSDSYSGLTDVVQGTLELNQTGGAVPVQGILQIGNGTHVENAVQQITLSGTGGTFTLSFNGVGTDPVQHPLLYNATAAQVQAALNALPSIGGVGGSVTVTQAGNVYTVTFGGALSNQVLPDIVPTGFNGVTVLTSTLQHGGNGQPDIQQAKVDGAAGQFVLTFNGATTTPLNYNATASNVAAALNALPTISGVGGSVLVTQAGDLFTITFGGTLANENLALMIGTPLSVSASEATTQVGGVTPAATVQLDQDNQVKQTSTITINGNGTFNLNGQNQTVANLLVAGGAVSVPAPGSLTLTANLIGSQDVKGNPATINGSGTLNVTNQIQVAGPGPSNPTPDLIIGANIATVGGASSNTLVKSGGGILQLTADETFSSPTTINAGLILADGPNAGQTLHDITLAGGGIGGLGSVGTVTTQTSGVVEPGDNANVVGTLSSLSETWNSSTTFYVILDSTGPGNYDTLSVTGNLAINNATLSGVASTNVNVGDSFTIITTTGGTITGKFAGTANDVFLNGVLFTVVYNPTSVVITREQALTTTTLASSVNPSSYGQNVVFTANVKPTVGPGPIPVADTVQFTLVLGGITYTQNVNVDANGNATFNPTTFLGQPPPVGTYTVTAAFNGDTAFLPSASQTISETVHATNTTTTLSSPQSNAVYGQTVNVTATVAAVAPGAGVPTGSVEFFVNGSAVPFATVPLNGSGQAVQAFNNLTGPGNIIKATFVPNTANYVGSNQTGSLTINVTKDTPLVTIQPSPASTEYSQTASFTVIVSAVAPGTAQPTGTATLYADGVLLGTQTLGAGSTTTFNVSSLAFGPHTITVSYSGDVNVASGLNAIAYNVSVEPTQTTIVSSANPTPIGSAVTFTAVVSSASPGIAPAIPTGEVTFQIDGVAQSPVALDANGSASLKITNLGFGPHTVFAEYDATPNFGFSSSASITQNILGTTIVSLVSSVPKVSVYGELITFNATVLPVQAGLGLPSGSVAFYDKFVLPSGATTNLTPIPTINAYPNPAPLHANTLGTQVSASFSVANLAAGTHYIYAIYSGDSTYVGSSYSYVVEAIHLAGTTISVQVPGTTIVGQSRSVVATITPIAPGGLAPGGSVNYYFNGGFVATVPINKVIYDASGNQIASQAIFTFASGGVGNYAVTAVFVGSGGYLNSSFAPNPAPIFKIVQATTSTTISALPTSVVYGQPVAITATVTEQAPGTMAPTGSVTIYDGATAIATGALNAAGKFILNSTTLPVGTASLTAKFTGNSNFAGSSSASVLVSVGQVSTSTNLGFSSPSPVYGQPLTITATVTSASPSVAVPLGNLVFTVDGVPQTQVPLNASGIATLTLTNLNAGLHTFSATYVPATGNFGSSGTPSTNLTVGQAHTTTSLVSSSPTSGVGDAVTFTATVLPVSPTVVTPVGSVTFYVDGNVVGTVAVNASGKAVLTTATGLSFGSHTIDAIYSGNSNFVGSDAGGITQTVVYGSSTSVTSSGPSVFGQGVTFTATVTVGSGVPTPTGTVSFYVDGNLMGNAGLSGNQAAVTLTTIPAGAHVIVAVYNGDSNFAPSRNNLGYTVGQANASATISSSLAANSYANQAVTFTATISAAPPGSGTPGGTVTFYINGVAAARAADVGGQARFATAGLGAGNYNIVAVYSGDSNFTGGATTFLVQHVVVAPPPAKIASSINAPQGTGAGVPFNLTIQAQNADGSSDSIYNGIVSISVASGPAGGALAGVLTVRFVNGVATFTGLEFTVNGPYVLNITTGGETFRISVTAGGGRGT
jgi:large repetitive protein